MCRIVAVRSPTASPLGRWTSTASRTPSAMVTYADQSAPVTASGTSTPNRMQ